MIPLNHIYNIYMKTNKNLGVFYERYLRKIGYNYYFYLLGKNGEPIGNAKVEFVFVHALFPNYPKQV
jgi:hypothetical protein